MAKSGIKKKLLKLTLILMVIALLVFIVGLHAVAPYAIIKPPKKNEKITPDQFELAFEKLSLQTKDSVNLVGYDINSESTKPRAVMILIHGIGGCKEHFLPLSKSLSEVEIASVIMDVRAHGESGGEYCSYGYYEKEDISIVVDFIRSKYPDTIIGIWGNSMGGAIALQSLEHDERIEFGVIESTFTSFRQIVFDYQKRMSHGFGLRFATDYALNRAGEIADFDPDEVQPIESAKNIEQPTFIAHGNADKNISIEYGKTLFDNLKSVDKEFYEVDGGRHFGLHQTGGDNFSVSIYTFIERQIKQSEL